MEATIVFDAIASIRQRVSALARSRDAAPTLHRQRLTNYNQIGHLQTDIEKIGRIFTKTCGRKFVSDSISANCPTAFPWN